MSRCLDPQTPPEKAFRGSKHLLTRYLQDSGRLGFDAGKKIVSKIKSDLQRWCFSHIFCLSHDTAIHPDQKTQTSKEKTSNPPTDHQQPSTKALLYIPWSPDFSKRFRDPAIRLSRKFHPLYTANNQPKHSVYGVSCIHWVSGQVICWSQLQINRPYQLFGGSSQMASY